MYGLQEKCKNIVMRFQSSSIGQFVDTVGSKMRDNMTIPVSFFFIETGK